MDSNKREPTEADKTSGENLETVMQSFNLIEDEKELQEREAVTVALKEIYTEWLKETMLNLQSEEIAYLSTGKLYTFGSYSLDVHNKGSDIDTLCIGPRGITHERFFSGLCKILRQHAEIEEMVTIPGAFVPIAKFKFRGIQIDLIYAEVALQIIREDFDIFDDNILRGMDVQSVRALNGYRNTAMIWNLVTNARRVVFKKALRFIKLWAKRRAVYSYVYGYAGGVAYAILVAKIVMLYPNANSSMIVAYFFQNYSYWPWPNPVSLNAVTAHPELTFRVWSSQTSRYDKMPVITPAYPAVNSTHSTSKSTLKVMKSELKRAYELCLAERNQPIDERIWREILEEYDFFFQHKHYLQVMCYSNTDSDQRVWIGWIESRIRHLVQYLEEATDSLNVRSYPSVVRCGDPGHPHCASFFIGLKFDRSKNKPKKINVTDSVRKFLYSVCGDAKSPKKPGMEVQMKSLLAHELPEYVFKDARRPSKKKLKQKKRKSDMQGDTSTSEESHKRRHTETNSAVDGSKKSSKKSKSEKGKNYTDLVADVTNKSAKKPK